jgi:hypothetical protein
VKAKINKSKLVREKPREVLRKKWNFSSEQDFEGLTPESYLGLCKQPLNKGFIEAIKRLADSAEKGKEKKKRLSDKRKSRKREKMRKVC